MFGEMPPFTEIVRSMVWLFVLAASFLMPILSIAFAVLSSVCLLGYLTTTATVAFGRRAFMPSPA